MVGYDFSACLCVRRVVSSFVIDEVFAFSVIFY